MNKKLLVTDSLFVKDEHIERLKSAGYDVVWLDTPSATEDELVQAIKGVSVYILGGEEKVTDRVISASDGLEAIIFCGVDYANYIFAVDAAKAKGIKLLNASDANAVAVAEFAVGISLFMQRELYDVSRLGDKKFHSTSSIQNSVVGIVGAGNIGSKIAQAVSVFQPSEIIYYNHTEKDIHARKVDDLHALVAESDIIFVSLPKSAGMIFNDDIIRSIKQNCLVVSISPNDLFDFNALLIRLKNGELRAAIDHPSSSAEFDTLPIGTWYSVNSGSGYNTIQAIRAVGDRVTDTALKLVD